MAKRKDESEKPVKRPRGRPRGAVEGSLRQDGYTLRVRMLKTDAERFEALAGDEGLSAVVRRLLEQWAKKAGR